MGLLSGEAIVPWWRQKRALLIFFFFFFKDHLILHWFLSAYLLSPHTLGNKRPQKLTIPFFSTSINLSSASPLLKMGLEFSVYSIDPKDEGAGVKPPK